MYRSLIFAALPLCLTLTACTPDELADTQKLRPAVMVRPQTGDGQQDVFPGEIYARYEPALAFRIGGKVSRRLVNVGDRVKQGQPLAELDASDLKLELDSTRAQLASAEADYRLAEGELTRYRALLQRQLVSQSQFETVESRRDASAAQLQRARAQLDVARNRASYAVLKAPQDGIIAERMVEAGQVVAAGQAVFALAVDGEREVRIDLPEQDIDRFEVGQTLMVELWSRPGQPFTGQIRELSPSADPASRTFEAKVAFDNKQVGAELGQSARVFVSDSRRKVPLAIPLAALTADGDRPFVWVLNPQQMTLHKTPVTTGPYGSEKVPVLSGLRANDWVVAAGTQLLQEGQRVRPVDRMNRPIEIDESLAQQL